MYFLEGGMLSCVRLCNSMDCSPPGSSIHGILQARILERVALPSSRGSSQPSDRTVSLMSPALAGGFFPTEPPRKPLEEVWFGQPPYSLDWFLPDLTLHSGLCGAFCPLCLSCQIASDMNEFCLCGSSVAMRTMYRTRYGIPVSHPLHHEIVTQTAQQPSFSLTASPWLPSSSSWLDPSLFSTAVLNIFPLDFLFCIGV